MTHNLDLTAKDLLVLSDFIQSGIDGDDCIIDNDHLAIIENLLKRINQLLILADDFHIE